MRLEKPRGRLDDSFADFTRFGNIRSQRGDYHCSLSSHSMVNFADVKQVEARAGEYSSHIYNQSGLFIDASHQ